VRIQFAVFFTHLIRARRRFVPKMPAFRKSRIVQRVQKLVSMHLSGIEDLLFGESASVALCGVSQNAPQKLLAELKSTRKNRLVIVHFGGSVFGILGANL
jgi:hypothetical protein